MDNDSLLHTKWNCKYHMVFTPKYRRQIKYKQISADIGTIIRTLCAGKGVEIITGGISSFASAHNQSRETLRALDKVGSSASHT